VDVTNIWVGKPDKVVYDVMNRLSEAMRAASAYGQDYRYVKRAILLGEPWRSKMHRIIDDLRQRGIDACSLQALLSDINWIRGRVAR